MNQRLRRCVWLLFGVPCTTARWRFLAATCGQPRAGSVHTLHPRLHPEGSGTLGAIVDRAWRFGHLLEAGSRGDSSPSALHERFEKWSTNSRERWSRGACRPRRGKRHQRVKHPDANKLCRERLSFGLLKLKDGTLLWCTVFFF